MADRAAPSPDLPVADFWVELSIYFNDRTIAAWRADLRYIVLAAT